MLQLAIPDTVRALTILPWREFPTLVLFLKVLGHAYDHERLGPVTMNLIPNEGTNTFGRTLFRIHGGNANGYQNNSTGCPVVGPNGRQQVSESNDNQLMVVLDENALNTVVQQRQNLTPTDQTPATADGLPALMEADPDWSDR